jgi:hypothetical protein
MLEPLTHLAQYGIVVYEAVDEIDLSVSSRHEHVHRGDGSL